MKYFKLAIIWLSLGVLSACTQDETLQTGHEKVTVQFSSIVTGEDGESISRASGTIWTANDKIGIFMKKAGQDLAAESIVNNVSNISYKTVSGDGFFAPVQTSEETYFPALGSVDFIAYYPYTDNPAGYTYTVNVSDQSDLEAIDLLYSNNVLAANKVNPQVKLQFDHVLSSIKFNISATNPASDLSGLKITLKGLPTEAQLDLRDGDLNIVQLSTADIEVQVSADGTTAEAIVLPVGLYAFDITFTLGSVSVTETINDMDLSAGSREVRNVMITGV
ncbi:fimbrillin family protein [Bacteroides sp. 51]|uniref:fimbrillin family protein n=1 Tax=Bacteroides sp. 51 TaxID=2302938 RepID=UPI0013CF71AF|nr:fimbrillin family protein [Bacteroides sp. 51]NDV82126.1 fimbrillin family protein [Bacteroides sp. 51]